MDRKFANLPGWKRILKHRFSSECVDTPEFKGYISLYRMDAVASPLMVDFFRKKLCIADSGYTWLKLFPANHNFTITAQYNDQGQLVMWYIDICLRMGIDSKGVPWMDDLYLDIGVSPDMEIEVKDADELQAALNRGEITLATYEMAWGETKRIINEISQREFCFLELCNSYRNTLLNSDHSL